MATLTETGEQVFAVLDETGKRRLATLVLEDGRRFFAPAGGSPTVIPRSLMATIRPT